MVSRSRFVLCIDSGDYGVSLETRKVYRVVADRSAESRALLRIVDETGEDYLFPRSLFVPIEVPRKAAAAFSAPAR
jgi:hypothetical protein